MSEEFRSVPQTVADLASGRPDEPGSKISRSCRAARGSGETFDAIAEGSQFADHPASTHLLRLFADGWSPFLVPHAVGQDLPDQTTESVGDGANCLGMAEAWDDPTVDDGKDRPLAGAHPRGEMLR